MLIYSESVDNFGITSNSNSFRNIVNKWLLNGNICIENKFLNKYLYIDYLRENS